MLTYSFENLGNTSLYEHLYNCIKKDILNGTLKKDEKLPSKRSLSKNLNISVITIETAYGQLMAEGYIYSLPKKGFYVSDLSEIMTSSGNDKEYYTNANSSRHLDDSPNIYLQKQDDYFIDLISNKTSPINFPFSRWAYLLREVISEEGTNLLNNSPIGGIYELKSAITKHLKQFRGIDVSPDQVIIGAGTEYIYGLIIQLFSSDTVYAIENPGHKKIFQIYDSHNVKCVHIPMNKDGVSISELEVSGANILHISPSHHFPTGIVTPISNRYKLLTLANKSPDRYIIEDDYDCEFRLQGNPIPSLKSIDSNGKVIYINTFSKSLSSTIRISYMVLPPSLLKLFYEKLGFYSCTVSTFEQYTLAKFIEKGYFEKHINRQRTYFKNQRNRLLDIIMDSPIADKCTITEEDSGLHFLMKLKTKLNDKSIKRACDKKGIKLALLSEYYYDEHDIPKDAMSTIVFNYSGLDLEMLPKALEIINEII
ncbi:MAG: PLP-dependent aminotransferase family protein [Lachnospiraceae bacterium]|nr:PLP-dependent aminotransferase family protein [Lachnospiraceae bacterium]